jgi:hypothetical protein
LFKPMQRCFRIGYGRSHAASTLLDQTDDEEQNGRAGDGRD